MKKVMERWQSHHFKIIALGAGQLDVGQQDQALSILEICVGFKCPPVNFSLAGTKAARADRPSKLNYLVVANIHCLCTELGPIQRL